MDFQASSNLYAIFSAAFSEQLHQAGSAASYTLYAHVGQLYHEQFSLITSSTCFDLLSKELVESNIFELFSLSLLNGQHDLSIYQIAKLQAWFRSVRALKRLDNSSIGSAWKQLAQSLHHFDFEASLSSLSLLIDDSSTRAKYGDSLVAVFDLVSTFPMQHAASNATVYSVKEWHTRCRCAVLLA